MCDDEVFCCCKIIKNSKMNCYIEFKPRYMSKQPISNITLFCFNCNKYLLLEILRTCFRKHVYWETEKKKQENIK